MVKRREKVIVVLLCICCCLMPCNALALSTADATEPISSVKECKLTISYHCEGTDFFELPVKLYKIADVSADCQYFLDSRFANSNLILNGIKTLGEWNVVRSTLETYIFANGIKADLTTETDENGQAHFQNLKTGLYLAITDRAIQDNLICSFDSALVSLPDLESDGIWQYEVEVASKPQIIPPDENDEEIEFKVVKLWKGDNNGEGRPKSIDVEIYRDGVSVETVALSEENHWTYSWSAPKDGANWAVSEKNIPQGYTMTVEEKESSFVVTNTLIPDEPNTPDTPQTGDTSNMLLYVILLSVSGIALIILAIFGKRRHL